MPKTLRLAKNLTLSTEAVTRQCAWIGRTGSGKTHACGKLVEGLLAAKIQTVILDSVGNWYGLRLAANGSGKGFNIPVFGGRHGDIPLEYTAGRLVAKVIVERGISVVLDISRFRKNQRDHFCMEFAEELFELKKENDSPLHLVVEEAQRVIPQHTRKGTERLKGAFEDICKIGRNFGIGWSLITQRPQAVDKEVLNQADPLFVFQTSGKHERKAIREWIDEQGVEPEVLKGLSKLAVGTCCFWSPQWLGRLERVHIEKKRTYDASATPKVGQKRRDPKPMAKRDLAKLRDEMKEMVERAEENSVRKLKARILELERELAKKPAPRAKEKKVEVQIISKANLRRLEVAAVKLGRIAEQEGKAATAAAKAESEIRNLITRVSKPLPTPAQPTRPTRQPAPRAAARVDRRPPIGSDEANLKPIRAGARRMLVAMATMARPLTRTQLSLLSGVKTTGGTFGTYLSDISTAGYAIEENGCWSITDLGLSFVGEVPYLDTSPEGLANYFKSKLRAGAQRMLTALMGVYPEGMSRDELSEACDVKRSGGTFGTYLSNLTTSNLARVDGQTVYAHDDLYVGKA